MSLFRTLSLTAVLPLLPVVAGAAGPGWYAGASYVNASPGTPPGFEVYDARMTDDGSGFKIIAGYQFLDWLAVEANYADLGNASGLLQILCIPEIECPGNFDIETRTLSLAAIASVGVGPVDFFARAGFGDWDTDVSFTGVPGSRLEGDGTDPVYGFGIRVEVKAVALRLEFERQDLDESHTDQLSFGATWSFGR